MQTLRLCHSVWTKPFFALSADAEALIEKNIWIFALSLAYIQQFRNTRVVLHTDDMGKKYWGFLPYDEICVSLNELDVSPCFWAAGKLKAQLSEPIGSIHVDGDVMLKKNELKEKLDFEKFDLIVQSLEPLNKTYISHLSVFRRFGIDFGDDSVKHSFNCGVIGFNDPVLKNNYIDNYFSIIKICENNAELISYIKKHTQIFSPDIITEQLLLANLAQYRKTKLKLLLPNVETISKDAHEIGFTHLLGQHKYMLVDKIKQRLRQLDPNLFEIVQNHINREFGGNKSSKID